MSPLKHTIGPAVKCSSKLHIGRVVWVTVSLNVLVGKVLLVAAAREGHLLSLELLEVVLVTHARPRIVVVVGEHEVVVGADVTTGKVNRIGAAVDVTKNPLKGVAKLAAQILTANGSNCKTVSPQYSKHSTHVR